MLKPNSIWGHSVPQGEACANSAQMTGSEVIAGDVSAGGGLGGSASNGQTTGCAAPEGELPDARKESRDRKDVVACGLAALLALIWSFILGDDLSVTFMLFGGVAFTLAIFAFFACVFVVKGAGMRLTKTSLALLVGVAALACVPAITCDPIVRAFNTAALAVVCMLEYMSLSGALDAAVFVPMGVVRAIGFFVAAQVLHLPDIFRWPSLKGISSKGQVKSALLGVLAGVCILAVVLPLLLSADEVFASAISGIFSMPDNVLEGIWRVMRFGLFFVLTASMLISAHRGGAGELFKVSCPTCKVASTVATTAFLVVLNVVYAAFAFVQVRYLFTGAETSAMQGGYAEYAREGFFQLVWVAAINLVVTLVVLWNRRDEKRSVAVTVCLLVLPALTGIILASSAWRLVLYVQCYGMSELRAFASLGIVIIAALLVVAVCKTLRPRIPFFRPALAIGLVLWCAFAFSGVSARVADYNVDSYLNGTVEHFDVDYLGTLSMDGSSAIERLAQADPKSAAYVRKVQAKTRKDYPQGWQYASIPQLLRGEG